MFQETKRMSTGSFGHQRSVTNKVRGKNIRCAKKGQITRKNETTGQQDGTAGRRDGGMRERPGRQDDGTKPSVYASICFFPVRFCLSSYECFCFPLRLLLSYQFLLFLGRICLRKKLNHALVDITLQIILE